MVDTCDKCLHKHLVLAHVVLFVWLFIGNLVFWTGDIPLSQNPPDLIVGAWKTLGFAALGLLLAGLVLIHKTTGRVRYIGYWLRFGADFLQTVILMIFMNGLLSGDFEDCPGRTFVDIMAIGVATIATYLLALVARDVVDIFLTERLATKLDRQR